MQVSTSIRLFLLVLGVQLSYGRAEPQNQKLLLNHLKNATQEYNYSVKTLKKQGLAPFENTLRFKLKKDERSHFRSRNSFLHGDILMGRIVFSHGTDVVLVVPVADFLQNKISLNNRTDYLNLEYEFSNIRQQVDKILNNSSHKRTLIDQDFREAANSSIALYSKVVYTYFKSRSVEDSRAR